MLTRFFIFLRTRESELLWLLFSRRFGFEVYFWYATDEEGSFCFLVCFCISFLDSPTRAVEAHTLSRATRTPQSNALHLPAPLSGAPRAKRSFFATVRKCKELSSQFRTLSFFATLSAHPFRKFQLVLIDNFCVSAPCF